MRRYLNAHVVSVTYQSGCDYKVETSVYRCIFCSQVVGFMFGTSPIASCTLVGFVRSVYVRNLYLELGQEFV